MCITLQSMANDISECEYRQKEMYKGIYEICEEYPEIIPHINGKWHEVKSISVAGKVPFMHNKKPYRVLIDMRDCRLHLIEY